MSDIIKIEIDELVEATTPNANDELLIKEASTGLAKKIKASNLVSDAVIQAEVDAQLAAHPEWTTTVEDGSITMDKLAIDTMDTLNSKADDDGYHDDMTVGFTKSILSDDFIQDTAPYLFRPTLGRQIDVKQVAEKLVGVSIPWNQLVQNGNFADTSGWSTSSGDTLSVSNNIATYTTATQYNKVGQIRDDVLQKGHTYFISLKYKTSSDSFYAKIGHAGYQLGRMLLSATDVFKTASTIANIPSDITYVINNIFFIQNYASSGTSQTIDFTNINVIDLTLALGSTIAGYAYTFETSEAGSGIAWLKSQGFFTKDYYAYNAGGIQSVKTSAKKVVGFNQWDEEWELGTISTADGTNTASSGAIRSKNYIPIIKGQAYYMLKSGLNVGIRWYDINKNYLGYASASTVSRLILNPATFNGYMRFVTNSTTVYNPSVAPICINFHWDGERDGEYEAYEEKTYPLDSDLELRGIPKLVDGKIKYNGDLYASDGSVTRKYGIVDLGSLTWQANTTGTADKYRMKASISGLKMASSATAKANLVCAKYVSVSGTDTYSLVVGICASHTEAAIFVYDSNYDTITSASAFKTAMDGVYLIYEKTTPTTESADPYTNPQWVDNWGTEEFIDTRTVQIPVGHESKYYWDIKNKLIDAPENPTSNGDYIVHRANNENSYVKISDLSEISITDNDLLYVESASDNKGYKVKAKDAIPTGAVVTAKIANGAVTADKVAAAAITEDKLGSNVVTTVKINDGAVTENKIADSAVTVSKLASDVLTALAEKADIDGYYEDMSVGSAEQLLSNTYEPDNTPYLYRTSGGSIEIGNRVYEDAIVGGSVAWNQLIDKSKLAAQTASPVTFTPNGDGSVTVVVEEDLTSEINKYLTANTRTSYIKIPANHKYVVYSNTARIGNTVFRNGYAGADLGWNAVRSVGNSDLTIYLGMRFPSGTPAGTYTITPQITDLTLAFGSTIADYVYSLEQATAGSGIAWLKSQGFFTKDYYAYNAGGIESVKTSAKKVVGFNQWDEQWELGQYNVSTGEKSNATNRIRCKNKIPVFPSTTYYFETSIASAVQIFYDNNENFITKINGDNNYFTARKTTFTTPANAYYMAFYLGTASQPDGKTCINLHWDGERDGEYEAYEEKTYPLDSDLELRGIPTLVDGKIKYDGDTYESDGTVTRKYRIVDLGTLDYVANTSGNKKYFWATFTEAKSYGSSEAAKMVCSKYVNVAGAVLSNYDKVISRYYGYRDGIVILDSAYAESTAEQFKSAMSGQYLVFELATPTTESADTYTNPQWVDNWGTEEFVDTRDVPVPVGHDSRYLPDLKAKLESAPSNPSMNGLYFLQYQNGEATYVPVPSEVPQTPSEDGTYILKATVSSGTATLSWVAEE